jgi:hypothetical protein
LVNDRINSGLFKLQIEQTNLISLILKIFIRNYPTALPHSIPIMFSLSPIHSLQSFSLSPLLIINLSPSLLSPTDLSLSLSLSGLSLPLSQHRSVPSHLCFFLSSSCSSLTFFVFLPITPSLDEMVHCPLTFCTRSPHPCQPPHSLTAGYPVDPSPVTSPFF